MWVASRVGQDTVRRLSIVIFVMVDSETESVFVTRSIAVREEDEEPVWLEFGRGIDLDVGS